MAEITDGVGQLSWVEPHYLNIDWKQDGVNRPNLPTPHKEITADEFHLLLHHGGYSLGGINFFSNLHLPDESPEQHSYLWAWQAHYYLFWNYALCIATRYMRMDEWESGSWQRGLGRFIQRRPDSAYGYAERFFRIGCDHSKSKELSPKEAREKGFPHHGMCWHVYYCPECDTGWCTDSSD